MGCKKIFFFLTMQHNYCGKVTINKRQDQKESFTIIIIIKRSL